MHDASAARIIVKAAQQQQQQQPLIYKNAPMQVRPQIALWDRITSFAAKGVMELLSTYAERKPEFRVLWSQGKILAQESGSERMVCQWDTDVEHAEQRIFVGSVFVKQTKAHLSEQIMNGGEKKPINRKHINIFLTALAGQSSQGRTPTCPRDKRDKMVILLWNSTEKGRFVPGTGPILSRGGVPFVPGTNACLSRTPSRRKCLCLLVFSLPE